MEISDQEWTRVEKKRRSIVHRSASVDPLPVCPARPMRVKRSNYMWNGFTTDGSKRWYSELENGNLIATYANRNTYGSAY